MDTEVRARLSANVGAFVSAMGQAAQSAEALNKSLEDTSQASKNVQQTTAQTTQATQGLNRVIDGSTSAVSQQAQATQRYYTAAQQANAATGQAARTTQTFGTNIQRTNVQTQQFNATLTTTQRLTRVVTGLFGAATVGLVAYAQKAFRASASVSELDGTLVAIAKSTGNSHKALVDTARAIEAMGIEMASARRIATKFAQNNLDLAQAARLARTAQDLAVVSQSNSTATLNRLIHGIMTGNSLVLRNAGVTGMAGKAYADYAKELGVVATALTPAQRQQAIINMIFREGEAVAGAYEASMLEAGKVLRSFPRILNNISVAFGNTMNKGFAPVILSAYNMTKAFAEAINVTPKLNKETGEVETKIGGLTEAIRGVTYVFNLFMTPLQAAVDRMTEFIKGISVSEEQVKRFVASIEPAIPILAALTAASAGAATKGLLQMIGPLQRFAGYINPAVVAIGVFVLANEEVRSALIRLAQAFQPLIPVFVEFAQQAAQVFTVFATVAVRVVSAVINALAGLVESAVNLAQGSDAIMRFARVAAIAFVLTRLKVIAFAQTLTITALKAVQRFATSIGATFSAALLRARTNIAALRLTVSLMNPAMAAATIATHGFKAALRGLATAVRGFMSATGVGLILVVLSLVVEAFITAYSSSQEFRDKVEGVLNAIISKVADTVNWIIRMANAVDGFFGGTGERFDEVDWKIELPPLDDSAWADIEFPSLEDIFGGDIDDTIMDVDDALDDLGETAASTAGAVDHLAQAMERFAGRVKNIESTAKDFGRWSETVVDFSDEVDKALAEVQYQTSEFDKTMSDSATTGDELVSSYRNMASAIRSQLSSALNTARQRLNQLQQEFDQFQSKIAGAISGIIDFKSALPVQEDARVYTGFVKALGDSLGLLEEPADSATSFADNLRKQANQAEDFSKKIRTLLEMGLSKDALEQVINAGYEAGSAIADEIIAGGVTLVDDINKMVQVVNDMALETGEQGAQQFFQAGIDMGQALVDAIVARIESERERIEGLIDAIVARLEAIAKAEADAASAAAAAAAARDVQANPFEEAAVDAKAIADFDWAGLSREVGSFGGYIPLSRSDAASVARFEAQADAAERARIDAARRAQAEARVAQTDRIIINQTNNISSDVEYAAVNDQLTYYLRASLR